MWGGSYCGIQGVCDTYSKKTRKGGQKHEFLFTNITK